MKGKSRDIESENKRKETRCVGGHTRCVRKVKIQRS